MRAWLRGNWSGLSVGLLIAGLVLVTSWFWRTPPTPVTVIVPTPIPSPTVTVVVHVTGAVQSPGVVTLPMGARVSEGIEQAGGLAEGADVSGLNLAARLVDGQRVSVPHQGGVRSGAVASLVDLNRASRAELEALPGIGAATAQRILEHRERQGPLQSLEQLREFRILSASAVERLRDLVVVE